MLNIIVTSSKTHKFCWNKECSASVIMRMGSKFRIICIFLFSQQKHTTNKNYMNAVDYKQQQVIKWTAVLV